MAVCAWRSDWEREKRMRLYAGLGWLAEAERLVMVRIQRLLMERDLLERVGDGAVTTGL